MRGFTLVELLVVIAIVALLVSLLFPVLRKVREQADRIKCAANLRSIGHAMTMYTQRYGYYPGCILQTPDGDAALWPVRLRAMIGGDRRVFNCPSQDERCDWDDDITPPRRLAGPHEVAYGYEEGEWVLGNVWVWFGYSYNAFGYYISEPPENGFSGLGAFIRSHGGGGPRAGLLRATRVKVPSLMIAVADSNADGMNDVGMLPQESSSQAPGTLHNRGCNVLFCDGHVQWHLQRDIVYDARRDPDSPRNIAVLRMWNYDHEPHN